MCLTGLVCCLILAAPPTDDFSQVYCLDTRTFAFPVQVDPARRNEVAKLRFYVSTDQGQSWKKVESAKVKKKMFYFTAPQDGTYWFVLATVGVDGSENPCALQRTEYARKVLIKTGTEDDDGVPPEH